MSEGWLLLSLLCALAAAASALWLAPAWERRDRISQRMEVSQRRAGADRAPEGWLLGVAERAFGTGFFAKDFREMDEALSLSAMTRERIVITYTLVCWALPIAGAIIGTLWYGLLGFLGGFALVFVLSRRLIRKHGEQAEAQMNREAVALCQLMRMFLETGMTLERSFRVMSQQAAPLMPILVRHIDTFNRRVEAGMDRSEALALLGRNHNVPVLYDLTILLRQTGVLGTGAGEAINALIQRANDLQRARLQESASKVSAKMSAVMVLCMMPALMILLAGPGLVSFSQLLR